MEEPNTESEAELDPREELAWLVSSLREHLLWQGALGTTGLPRDPEAKQRVQADYALLSARPPTASHPSERHPGPEHPTSKAVSSAPTFSGKNAALGGVPLEVPPATASGAPSSSATVAAPLSRSKSLPLLTTDLGELRKMVSECTSCSLHEKRTQTVFSRGTGSSRLVFIGEAPGEEEDRKGEPFVGPAGQLLDKMIDAMGFTRDEVYVANIVKCRPPDNRKPDPSEMAKCRPYLEAQLAALQPECVVALGATALTGLFGPNEGITKARGRFRTFGADTLVMPTYHPAYLLRVPSAKKDTWADLLQVVRAMGRTPKAR